MNSASNAPLDHIESVSNPLVKELRELRTPKGRKEQRRFIAEGGRTLEEAARAGWRASILLVGPDGEGTKLTAERVIRVSNEVLSKVTGRENPQPLLGVFAEPAAGTQGVQQINPSAATRWLMLEGPRDPGNLGSCIRSADAVAAGGVILVGDTCDPYSVECVRATMGSIFAVPIFRLSDTDARELLARWPGESAAVAYRAPAMIVVGTEAEGLSPALRAACRVAVSIPMLGRAESLNLGVAAAITLYAAERAQR